MDAITLVKLERLPVVCVPISSLAAADSPRRSGEDPEHARTLAESGERLPPIVVHRPTMRVIDGMHRLRAAMLCGRTEIEVRFVDGDEASSFVLAVSENVRHGLPLSLSDRKAAAERIICSYPHWSDRMVGSVACLSGKTISAVRQRVSEVSGVEQPVATVGRDGRLRPRDGAQRREIARELMLADPGASLRQIARQAGISPETARHVRKQLNAGQPMPPHAAAADGANAIRSVPSQLSAATAEARLASRAFEGLISDPAFRSSERGRTLLRMLAAYQAIRDHGDLLAENIPPHCLDWVVAVAGACSLQWQTFADAVAQRKSTCFESERIALPKTGGTWTATS
jgi:ParB-like chromosome segregation protein Spo0J